MAKKNTNRSNNQQQNKENKQAIPEEVKTDEPALTNVELEDLDKTTAEDEVVDQEDVEKTPEEVSAPEESVEEATPEAQNEEAPASEEVVEPKKEELPQGNIPDDPVTIAKPEEVKNTEKPAMNTAPTVSATAKPKSFKAGNAIRLTNEPLYNSASNQKPMKKITGIYFIYDDVSLNGRHRITDKRGYVRKGVHHIVGWIKE